MNRSVGAQRRQHQERARQCRCLTLTPRELSLLKQLVKWGRLTCLWQRWGWLVPVHMSRSQFNFTPASASFVTDDEDEFSSMYIVTRVSLHSICCKCLSDWQTRLHAEINTTPPPLEEFNQCHTSYEQSSGHCSNKQVNKLSPGDDRLSLVSFH